MKQLQQTNQEKLDIIYQNIPTHYCDKIMLWDIIQWFRDTGYDNDQVDTLLDRWIEWLNQPIDVLLEDQDCDEIYDFIISCIPIWNVQDV